MGYQSMGRAEARIMFARIKVAKEEAAEKRRTEAAHRISDPLEQAKRFLQSRGWPVFSERILTGRWKSQNIIVGTKTLTANEVIEMADRVRAQMT